MKRSTRTSTSHRAYVDVDEQDNDFNNDDPMDVDEIPKVKTRRRAQTTKSPSKRKAKNAPEGELDSSLIRAIHSINATNVLNVPSLEVSWFLLNLIHKNATAIPNSAIFANLCYATT